MLLRCHSLTASARQLVSNATHVYARHSHRQGAIRSMSVAAPPREAEVVLRGDIQLGESPVWSEVDNVLYFVDIDGKAVHSYDPSNGRHVKVDTPAKAAAVIPTNKAGVVVACMEAEVAFVAMKEDERGEPGMRDTIATVPAQYGTSKGWRFNDCRATPGGAIIAGRINHDTLRDGWVLKFPSPKAGPADWASPAVLFGENEMTLPNGFVWNMSKRLLYYNDTAVSRIYVFDCDEAGLPVHNSRRVLREFNEDEGSPDGMTIDADGNLWVAMHAAGRVACFDPDTVREIHTVTLPLSHVSAVNFGGPGLRTLYITSIRSEGDDAPLAGALFKAEVPGVHGARAAYPFLV